MGWPSARFQRRPRPAAERRGALCGATTVKALHQRGNSERCLIWPIGFLHRRREVAAAHQPRMAATSSPAVPPRATNGCLRVSMTTDRWHRGT